MEDRERLISGKWLNCRLIEAAQALLAGMFPDLKGLQSPLYGEKLRFKKANNFIQILNVERCHWITISNVGCEEGVVNVYDSAYNTLSLATKKQICSLWQPVSSQVKFCLANIQRQPNSTDCGLFAIASATEVAYAKDPTLCYWDIPKMREHLAVCLESGTMTSFPLRRARRQCVGHEFKSITEVVYCTCRMPNDPNISMICCNKCNEEVPQRVCGGWT